MNEDTVLYAINVQNVHKVAEEELGRKLSEKEVTFVEDRLGEYLDWYEAIFAALQDLLDREKNPASVEQ